MDAQKKESGSQPASEEKKDGKENLSDGSFAGHFIY
jgi:hypothetical protein